MIFNRIVGECRACKPIRTEDGKLQSQWVHGGGCPYCGSSGLMRVKGYLEYIAQYNGNKGRNLTKTTNMCFGIKL